MLRSNDEETEILLGNKQLIGIFFVIVVLLGVAFTGGYMVGRRGPAKPAPAPATTQDTAATASPASAPGETHSLTPETPAPADQTTPEPAASQAPETQADTSQDTAPPLGSRTHSRPPQTGATSSEPAFDAGAPPSRSDFAPEAGQEFLQVAAVGRDEAEAVADVLHKKGFRAHAVPKPGNPKLYRVLIGPIRDAGDLSTTRDALRHTGFREVIVQKY